MKREDQHMASQDERFEDDAQAQDAQNQPPEPEAFQRHRQHPESEIPEIRSTQLVPEPLDEHDEPTLQPQILKFNQPTRHNAK